MRIAEIFRSIQGEGALAGTPSVFVRTTGCNLRCWFCDTPYTSWTPEGEVASLDDVLRRVADADTEHVVVTGGEPMLQRDVVPLSEELLRRGHHITIETAGTVFRPVACDLMSISPKLANSTPDALRGPALQKAGFSNKPGLAGGRLQGPALQRRQPPAALLHEGRRFRPDVLRRLAGDYACQFKFVIDRPEDCDDVEKVLTQLPFVTRSDVFLMPQGTTPEELHDRAAWLVPYCIEHGLRFTPRLHIELFGNQRGT